MFSVALRDAFQRETDRKSREIDRRSFTSARAERHARPARAATNQATAALFSAWHWRAELSRASRAVPPHSQLRIGCQGVRCQPTTPRLRRCRGEAASPATHPPWRQLLEQLRPRISPQVTILNKIPDIPTVVGRGDEPRVLKMEAGRSAPCQH